MIALSTDQLCKACRIFFRFAYPAGEDSIPQSRTIYLDLPPGKSVAECHSANPFPPGSFQVLKSAEGKLIGYSLRLGCSHFPHLKLKTQWIANHGNGCWLFTVDTHDAFSADNPVPPPDHPDAEKWTRLQNQNRELKEVIEREWEKEGLVTFNELLREGLQHPVEPIN